MKGGAKKFHFVVSWKDQHCSAYMKRKLSMNIFFVGVCCELVHGDCLVVKFGLCRSAAIFPDDDMARSDSRLKEESWRIQAKCLMGTHEQVSLVLCYWCYSWKSVDWISRT